MLSEVIFMKGSYFKCTWALCVALVFGQLGLAERQVERPNILFVFGEDWGMDTGAYGNTVVSTPVFDRLAEEGVLFTHAFATAPSCSPSKASVLTGQMHWRLGASVSHSNEVESMLNVRYRTYADALLEAGYATGYTGKGGWKNQFNKAPEGAGRVHNPAGEVSLPFDAFIENQPEGQPFCYWLGSGYAHRKFKPGSGVESGKKLEAVSVPPCWPDVAEIRSDILDYYVEVEEGDRDAGQAIEILEQKGLIENTIVIIAGDHGWSFPMAKANLYDMGLRVPLVVRWGNRIQGPTVARGRVIEDLVSLQDLAPTFLEAAGVDALPNMTAKSLMPLLQSSREGILDSSRKEIFAGLEVHVRFYPMRSIRTRDYLLIRNFLHTDSYGGGGVDNGPTKELIFANKENPLWRKYYQANFGSRPEYELYDVSADPYQLTNLAGKTEYGNPFESLNKRLEAYLRETGDPRISQKGPVRMLFADKRAASNGDRYP
jgi:N-sulfoglucosamine sulfohydrolase